MEGEQKLYLSCFGRCIKGGYAFEVYWPSRPRLRDRRTGSHLPSRSINRPITLRRASVLSMSRLLAFVAPFSDAFISKLYMFSRIYVNPTNLGDASRYR